MYLQVIGSILIILSTFISSIWVFKLNRKIEKVTAIIENLSNNISSSKRYEELGRKERDIADLMMLIIQAAKNRKEISGNYEKKIADKYFQSAIHYYFASTGEEISKEKENEWGQLSLQQRINLIGKYNLFDNWIEHLNNLVYERNNYRNKKANLENRRDMLLYSSGAINIIGLIIVLIGVTQ